jgi:hypothetical protein
MNPKVLEITIYLAHRLVCSGGWNYDNGIFLAYTWVKLLIEEEG